MGALTPVYDAHGVTLYHGDCVEVLAALAADGLRVDAYLEDPPYGREFMGRDWDYGIPGARCRREARRRKMRRQQRKEKRKRKRPPRATSSRQGCTATASTT